MSIRKGWRAAGRGRDSSREGGRKSARVICRTGQSSPTCCPVPLPVWPCGCCCCCLRCSPDAVVMSACCCPCTGYTRCPAAARARLTQHLCQRNWPAVIEPHESCEYSLYYLDLFCHLNIFFCVSLLSGMPSPSSAAQAVARRARVGNSCRRIGLAGRTR